MPTTSPLSVRAYASPPAAAPRNPQGRAPRSSIGSPGFARKGRTGTPAVPPEKPTTAPLRLIARPPHAAAVGVDRRAAPPAAGDSAEIDKSVGVRIAERLPRLCLCTVAPHDANNVAAVVDPCAEAEIRRQLLEPAIGLGSERVPCPREAGQSAVIADSVDPFNVRVTHTEIDHRVTGRRDEWVAHPVAIPVHAGNVAVIVHRPRQRREPAVGAEIFESVRRRPAERVHVAVRGKERTGNVAARIQRIPDDVLTAGKEP